MFLTVPGALHGQAAVHQRHRQLAGQHVQGQDATRIQVSEGLPALGQVVVDGAGAERLVEVLDRLLPGPVQVRFAQAAEEAGFGSIVKVGGKKVFQPDVVIHDLRRTFNTVCAELGYPPQVFDALLGHKVAGMAGVYTRLSPAGGILAEASQATADWIAAALDGRQPKLGEKIKALQPASEPEVKEATA